VKDNLQAEYTVSESQNARCDGDHILSSSHSVARAFHFRQFVKSPAGRFGDRRRIPEPHIAAVLPASPLHAAARGWPATWDAAWRPAARTGGARLLKTALTQVSAPACMDVSPDLSNCQQRFFELRFFRSSQFFLRQFLLTRQCAARGGCFRCRRWLRRARSSLRCHNVLETRRGVSGQNSA
jgi:hypothetical protein